METKKIFTIDKKKMDPSALDQLLQSKLHREVELRRPFEKVLRETEKRRSKLQVLPVRRFGSAHRVAEVPNVKEFREFFQLHRSLLEQCPETKMTHTQIKGLLQTYLTSYRNEKLMSQIHCMTKQLLQVMADSSKDRHSIDSFNIPFLAPQLRSLFSPVRRVAASRLRDIYSIGFDNQLKDCFILKYPSSLREGLYSTLHETVISYRLNTLRNRTTGFQYGLGGFFCSLKENLCDSRYPATFLGMYEYVPGDSLEHAIETLSRTELLQLLLQIGNLLLLATREQKFRHNRLFARNVILRKQSEKKLSMGSYKFTSSIQPVLVDFSHSILYVEDSQKWVSPEFGEKHPIELAQTEAPMWDIYVLLHSLMVRCYTLRSVGEKTLRSTDHLTVIGQILRWIQTQMTSVFLLEDLVKIQQFPYAEVQEWPEVGRRTDLVEEIAKIKVEDWMKYLVSLLI